MALAVGWFGSGGPPSAHAEPLLVVEGETLEVSAKRLDVDVAKGTALLEGDVRIGLGDLVLSSPKLELSYDQAPRVRWAKGSGGVKATMRGIEATASTVELDVAGRSVVLRGAVRLARGKGWVEAAKASIDLDTRKVTLHEVKGSIPVQPPKR